MKEKDVILSNTDLFKNTIVKPLSLGLIGVNGKTFVLKIENTEQLTEIRNLFEKKLPEFESENLPFLPHITVKKKKSNVYLAKIPDLSKSVEVYSPTSIGIFYRTEENATALLFSHKI